MGDEYLPLHKEFGIFMVGWTGAVTVVVAIYYVSSSPVWQPQPSLVNITYDWITGMMIGIGGFWQGWIIGRIYMARDSMVELVKRFILSWLK